MSQNKEETGRSKYPAIYQERIEKTLHLVPTAGNKDAARMSKWLQCIIKDHKFALMASPDPRNTQNSCFLGWYYVNITAVD